MLAYRFWRLLRTLTWRLPIPLKVSLYDGEPYVSLCHGWVRRPEGLGRCIWPTTAGLAKRNAARDAYFALFPE